MRLSMRTNTLIPWDANRTRMAPFVIESFPYRASCNVIFQGPFAHGLRFAKSSQISITASISSLFLSGGPFNVIWFIVPAVFYAFYGMTVTRTTTDVSQKFFVRNKPKLDSSSTIIGIVFVLGIITAFAGLTIRSKFWRNMLSAFFVRLTAGLFNAATTGLCQISSQILSMYCSAVAALTKTMPHSSLGMINPREADDKKFTESLTSQNLQTRAWFFGIRISGKVVDSHDAKATPFVDLVRVGRSYNFFRPAVILA